MSVEKMNEWLGAVEYLITSGEGCYVENDFGDYVIVGNMCGGRYEKYNCEGELVGLTDDVVEAVMWLIEMEDN